MPVAGPLRAADPEWKIGLRPLKITPEQPLYLAGYAAARSRSTRSPPICMPKLALEDREGHVAVLSQPI